MSFDASKVLAILADARPRKAARWYLEAKSTLSARELLALEALEDDERAAKDRRFLKSLQRYYRQRRLQRAAPKAATNVRKNVEVIQAELNKLFGERRPVKEETIKAAYLKSAGLTHAEIAALLGEKPRGTKRTPGGRPLGAERRVQKRLARERSRWSSKKGQKPWESGRHPRSVWRRFREK